MMNESCLQKFTLEYQHRLSKKTLIYYQIAIREFFAYSQTSYHQVVAKDIRKWILELEKKQRVVQTINAKISALKTFYKFCYEDQLMNTNPTTSINLLQIPEQPTYYLQYEQLRQLQQLVEPDLEKRTMVELLYTTGVRVGELTTIREEDINWEERFILIFNGKRKKERIVCFTRTCAEYLQAFLQEQPDESPYVFMNKSKNGPASVRTLQHYFKQYAERLGFRLTPHTLRHTFAAHLAQKGMPLVGIQTLLGHEKAEQTQFYARLFNDARKDMYDQWMD